MDGDTFSVTPCKECELLAQDGDTETVCCQHLRDHLRERDDSVAAMQTRLSDTVARCGSLQEQADIWREKYERLYEAYERVQKLNQTLEERLLQTVERARGDKTELSADIATLSLRLANAKHQVHLLHKENERYKNDMNLAIQLLQCKPDNFVSHKLDNLPADTQTRVSQFVMAKTKPSPLPPHKNGTEERVDSTEYEFNVSASLMAKILEESMQDTVTKHCDTCCCMQTKANLFSYDETHYSVATQTLLNGESRNSLCLNCNGDINSLRSNISNRSGSPQVHRLMVDEKNASPRIVPLNTASLPLVNPPNIVKENDVVNDKIKMEEKRKLAAVMQREITKKIGEDLDEMKNNFAIEPTAHHRLCERTKTPNSNDLLCEKQAEKEIERKQSSCSGGAVSRASSVAKSSASTQRSNTHVGPGPRFCSLRVQAGSKNILLDNAQPDVPPVLYTRQSRSTDLLRDDEPVEENRDDNANVDSNPTHVVESTLVDVHVDSNSKENISDLTIVNPVLMNVSASPLQPLKAHSFPEPQINKPFANVNFDLIDELKEMPKDRSNGIQEANADVKMFNFDIYEQNALTNQLPPPLRKIDMSLKAHIENTKISKDSPPVPNTEPDITKLAKQINVYRNVIQTQLKVTDSNKAVIKEQSTSSLSSDDSMAILQKQQLIRVAEWVQQNLDQQNNFSESDPYKRRDSKNNKDPVLRMPHPVTKYSGTDEGQCAGGAGLLCSTIVKETVFPAELDAAPLTEDKSNGRGHRHSRDEKVSPEELARMEYNVKRFLLSGSPWPQPRNHDNQRKTETDL